MAKLGVTNAIEQNKLLPTYYTTLAFKNLSRAKFFMLLMLMLDYKLQNKVAKHTHTKLYTRDNEMCMCGYGHAC